MNSVETRKHSIDPRTGLFLLILANIIAFTQNSVWVEFGWNFTLVLLLLLCGCVRAGFKNLKYQEAAKGKLLCDAGCKPSVVL